MELLQQNTMYTNPTPLPYPMMVMRENTLPCNVRVSLSYIYKYFLKSQGITKTGVVLLEEFYITNIKGYIRLTECNVCPTIIKDAIQFTKKLNRMGGCIFKYYGLSDFN